MNAISILFAGNLKEEAHTPLCGGKNALALAQEQAALFPGASKTVLLEGANLAKGALLNKIAELQPGYDFAYFAFADSPFLDPVLAGKLAERHIRCKAEYSYADGFPQGFAPEILAPGTAAILSKILGGGGDSEEPAERDIIFSVLQKDINAFDIETEISEIDLRCHRLNLFADSKRNLLLLNNFINANNGKIPSAEDAKNIIQTRPAILRTLPAFYPIQVYGGCPSARPAACCELCPYPLITDAANRNDFMKTADFEALLGKISAFSGDAVIDISLWGELSLHPEKYKLIDACLNKKELTLVAETSGIGWNLNELESYISANAQKVSDNRLNWIVSVNSSESEACAKKLLALLPKNTYVETIRIKGSEDETEKFFKQWKDNNVIIQKYNDFCGRLEKKQASDISPVTRQPCWHIMRDMPILIDGTVPLCGSELDNARILGNALNEPLNAIWKNGEIYYNEHCNKNYSGICGLCDEYYTFNF